MEERSREDDEEGKWAADGKIEKGGEGRCPLRPIYIFCSEQENGQISVHHTSKNSKAKSTSS